MLQCFPQFVKEVTSGLSLLSYSCATKFTPFR
jgi:hypothetical protein